MKGEPQQPSGTNPSPDAPADYHVFRLRRRSFAEWCGWLLWLIGIGILLEYALASFAEQERQAGILSGILCLGLFCAGVIVEVMKSVELSSQYHSTVLSAQDQESAEKSSQSISHGH